MGPPIVMPARAAPAVRPDDERSRAAATGASRCWRVGAPSGRSAPGVRVAPRRRARRARARSARAARRAATGCAPGPAGAGGGAVWRRNCSIAAATAAASAGEAAGARRSRAWGGGWASGGEGYRPPPCPTSPSSTTTPCWPPSSPEAAIDAVRDAFGRHHRGEWVMPAKIYLDRPAARRLPRDAGARRRAGDAQVDLLVPGQPGAGPADGHRRGLRLRRAHRRAARAARRARGHRAAHRARWPRSRPARSRREDARTVGLVGCGLHGAWAARCLAAAGYGPGVCADPDAEAAGRAGRRARLGRPGTRDEALACDVVCCVTPGHRARGRARATCARACT